MEIIKNAFYFCFNVHRELMIHSCSWVILKTSRERIAITFLVQVAKNL